MRLPGCQPEPDQQPSSVYEGVDLRREPVSAVTEIVISIPLLAVAACWWSDDAPVELRQVVPAQRNTPTNIQGALNQSAASHSSVYRFTTYRGGVAILVG